MTSTLPVVVLNRRQVKHPIFPVHTCTTGDFKEAHESLVKAPQFTPDAYAKFLSTLHGLSSAEWMGVEASKIDLANWILQVCAG